MFQRIFSSPVKSITKDASSIKSNKIWLRSGVFPSEILNGFDSDKYS